MIRQIKLALLTFVILFVTACNDFDATTCFTIPSKISNRGSTSVVEALVLGTGDYLGTGVNATAGRWLDTKMLAVAGDDIRLVSAGKITLSPGYGAKTFDNNPDKPFTFEQLTGGICTLTSASYQALTTKTHEMRPIDVNNINFAVYTKFKEFIADSANFAQLKIVSASDLAQYNNNMELADKFFTENPEASKTIDDFFPLEKDQKSVVKSWFTSYQIPTNSMTAGDLLILKDVVNACATNCSYPSEVVLPGADVTAAKQVDGAVSFNLTASQLAWVNTTIDGVIASANAFAKDPATNPPYQSSVAAILLQPSCMFQEDSDSFREFLLKKYQGINLEALTPQNINSIADDVTQGIDGLSPGVIYTLSATIKKNSGTFLNGGLGRDLYIDANIHGNDIKNWLDIDQTFYKNQAVHITVAACDEENTPREGVWTGWANSGDSNVSDPYNRWSWRDWAYYYETGAFSTSHYRFCDGPYRTTIPSYLIDTPAAKKSALCSNSICPTKFTGKKALPELWVFDHPNMKKQDDCPYSMKCRYIGASLDYTMTGPGRNWRIFVDTSTDSCWNINGNGLYAFFNGKSSPDPISMQGKISPGLNLNKVPIVGYTYIIPDNRANLKLGIVDPNLGLGAVNAAQEASFRQLEAQNVLLEAKMKAFTEALQYELKFLNSEVTTSTPARVTAPVSSLIPKGAEIVQAIQKLIQTYSAIDSLQHQPTLTPEQEASSAQLMSDFQVDIVKYQTDYLEGSLKVFSDTCVTSYISTPRDCTQKKLSTTQGAILKDMQKIQKQIQNLATSISSISSPGAPMVGGFKVYVRADPVVVEDGKALQMVVSDINPSDDPNTIPTPIVIDSNDKTITLVQSGTIFLKVPDPDLDYIHNEGSYDVSIYNKKRMGLISSLIDKVIDLIRTTMANVLKTGFENVTCSSVDNKANCSEYVSALKSMITLYIIVYALMFTFGLVQVSQLDFVIRVVKIGIILSLLRPESFTFFYEHLFNLYIDGGNEIIAKATQVHPGSNPFIFFDDIITTFFLQAEPYIFLVSLLFSGLAGIIYFIILIIVMFKVIKVFFNALRNYIMCLVAVSFLLILAPIMIPLMLFEVTKDIFETWLRYLFRYAFEPVLTLIGVGFLMGLLVSLVSPVFSSAYCLKCTIPFFFTIPIPGLNFSIPLFCIPGLLLWGVDNTSSGNSIFNVLSLQSMMAVLILGMLLDKWLGFVSSFMRMLAQAQGMSFDKSNKQGGVNEGEKDKGKDGDDKGGKGDDKKGGDSNGDENKGSDGKGDDKKGGDGKGDDSKGSKEGANRSGAGEGAAPSRAASTVTAGTPDARAGSDSSGNT